MKYRRIPLLFALALLPGCAADPAPPEATAPVAQNAPERRYINSRSAQDPDVPPFSGGVMVGNTFYVAGTIGLLPDQTVPETAQEEARIVLTNVRNTLEAAGLTMDDLVSVQVLLLGRRGLRRLQRGLSHVSSPRSIRRGHIWARARLLFEARFEVLGFAVKR